MPPVSESYRRARRAQIVDAAARCVARSGFRGTSMSDVFAESGLSAGAVYGYFSGKDDLVAAIIEQVLAELGAAVDAVCTAPVPPPLDEVVEQVLEILDRAGPDGSLARLAVQIWAEAVADPVLRERLAGYYRQARAGFADLARRYRDDGALDPRADVDHVAQVLTAIGPAFLAQRALLDDVTPASFAGGLVGLRPPPGPNGGTVLADH